MGFKSNRGGGRPHTGRNPKDQTKPKIRDLNDDEKADYERKLKAIQRNQVSTPQKWDSRYVGSKSQASLSLSSPTAAKRGRGRIAGSQSGPETPNTRRRKNTEFHQSYRQKENLSKIRSESANKRWKQQTTDDVLEESGVNDSTDTLEEIVHEETFDTNPEELADPRKRLFVDENDDENEINFKNDETNRTDNNPHGSMSKTSYYKHLKMCEESFQKHTDSWQERIDVTVNLIARSSEIVKPEKIQIRMLESDYRKHMKETRFSRGMNRKIGKKANFVREELKLCSEPEIILEDFLLKNILNKPFLSNILEMLGVKIEDSLKPKFQNLREIKNKIQDEITSKRHINSGSDRFLANRVAIQLSELANLSVDTRGDIELLANTLESSRGYAKRILQAIKDGNTKSLLKRDMRKDAIKCTDWPEKLAEFAKEPTYSRASPYETVSIGWKVRAPKFILNMKRQDVLKSFKNQHPDCNFSISVLNREWPQNVVTPSDRDNMRNVCEIHSNARRMEKCLRKNGLLKGIYILFVFVLYL